MKKRVILPLLVMLGLTLNNCGPEENYRTISVKEYKSKMQAGWLGQMAGVGWGAPTEFKFNGEMIPEDKFPDWTPDMLNQQFQDDLYVEMTFIKTLEDYGFDVSIRQAGIDFANSKYRLWHANRYARENLRAGIAPPYSGHPQYNKHTDDIDYQIEADYSGLIAPGMPQMVIELGDTFGRIMNFGDGLYGGIFVGAMYAEAFFETDIVKIIEAGLASIPAESQFAEAVRDVMVWHKQHLQDWVKTWHLINEKYQLNPEYRKFTCSGVEPAFNIDAKINAAYIVMGLLYGAGDLDETIRISMRCGLDSDCNPSNAAGVLATSMGMENLPTKYKTNIDYETKFSFTAYNFPDLIKVNEALARQAVIRNGGKVGTDAEGQEYFVIPKQFPVPEQLQQSWDVEPVTGDVNYTAAEMAKIIITVRKDEDYVKLWQVSEAFSKEGVDGFHLFDIEFGPELDQKYAGWQDFPLGQDGYNENIVELDKYFNLVHHVAYLRTRVWSESTQDVFFELGSDDGIKAWLNTELVHKNNILRGHNQAEDIIKVSLKEGWNEVLIKINQGEGGWRASLVITDLKAKVLHNLQYSL